MKFHTNLKLSIALAIGLNCQVAQTENITNALTVAGLVALPGTIKLATDPNGGFYQLCTTAKTNKKIGLNGAAAVTTGLLVTSYKTGGRLPTELSRSERNEALIRSGIALGVNQAYLSQPFQHLLRSVPYAGHYLACECEGICDKCENSKMIALGLIDTAVNLIKVK